ncbi:serine hydrolase [uncultured Bifidobacterium sp.]|uniref:serine hydrolase n=1 Tax=uncultured Bifidobacterium sp. TaxID=165187 RepID=UPI0028DBE492|nr:serine hydrolase [uncultured Bifidobacterium sp.]
MSALLVVLIVIAAGIRSCGSDDASSSTSGSARGLLTSVLSRLTNAKSGSSVSSSSSTSGFGDADDPTARTVSAIPASAAATTNLTSRLTTSLDSIFSGATYAVDVIDMSTGGTVVGIDTDTIYTSASTYKLYVAYSMISAVESGEKTWESELDGQTLQSCFATMIVNSDNDCPVAWLKQQGFSAVNTEVHDAGFADTTIEDYNMRTDAADLADYLTRLYQGSFMDADSRAMLIKYMKTQVYRSGIPTGIGSNGTVADKVGFLDDLLHDASIIYTTKGDYVMVILTNGSSWASIAEAASTIYAAL